MPSSVRPPLAEPSVAPAAPGLEQYQLVAAYARDLICLHEPRGELQYVSPACRELLGFEPEELMGVHPATLIHPDDLARVGQDAYVPVLQGVASSVTYRLRRQDGSYGWFECYAAPVYGAGGALVQIMSSSRDVTERVEAEAAALRRRKEVERQSTALVALSKRLSDSRDNLQAVLRQMTEVAAEVLDVRQVSVWFLDEARTALNCADLFDQAAAGHSAGLQLTAAEYPSYFLALEEARAIVADDARTHPATCEFSDNYLAVHGITSLLDAPVRLRGATIGVVCLEHAGPPRTWTPEEQSFAGSVADYVALAVEAAERARTERALRESRARYQAVVDSVREVIFETDARGRWTFLNAAWTQATGFSVAESLGRLYLDFVHPDDRRRNARAFLQLLRDGGDQHRHEVRYLAKDGGFRWTEVNVKVVRDAAGEAAGVRGTLADVTERKHTEAALRESEARFRHIYDNAPVMMHSIDEDGCLLNVNRRWLEATGYTREEVIGRPATFLMTPESAERATNDVVPRFWREGFVRDVPYQFRRKDGSVLDVLVDCDVTTDPARGTRMSLSVVRDVTGQKKAEAALRESQQLLSSINRNLTEGIYRSTVEGRLVYVNEAFARQFGYATPEEMTDVPSFRLYADSAERERLKQMVAEDGSIRNVEVRFQRRDGSVFWGLVSSTPLRDAAGRILYYDGAVSDITGRKRYEAELIAAKEKAEELNRLKSSFLANMSHEIRTPLTSIIGFADILAEDATPQNREFAQLIQRSGERLMETLNSVLDLAQLEGRALRLVPEPLDVQVLAAEALQLFRPQAQQRGLSLALEGAGGDPVVALADRAALDRVLTNLISNAVKFTRVGGVTVSVTSDDDAVLLAVRDTGIGIAPAFLPHIFDEFKQESDGMARDFEGSGLGLTITKRLVEMMDGTIAVTSAKGGGSTFTLRLPRYREAVPEAPHGPSAEPPAAAACAGRRVLVVEDNAETRRLLEYLLRDRYQVQVVGSADEALAHARRDRYEVVLMDVNLGEVRTGLDVLHLLRALPGYAAVPVVACTAYGLPGDREHFLNAGFQGYLSKPLTRQMLDDALTSALAGA